jgi:hypothetical protein
MTKTVLWEDISSYSRGESRKEINSVQANAGILRIVIHHLIYDPGHWYLSTYPDMFTNRILSSETLEDAKAEAIYIVRSAAAAILNDLE